MIVSWSLILGEEAPDEIDRIRYTIKVPTLTLQFSNRFNEEVTFEDRLCSCDSDFITETNKVEINKSNMDTERFFMHRQNDDIRRLNIQVKQS